MAPMHGTSRPFKQSSTELAPADHKIQGMLPPASHLAKRAPGSQTHSTMSGFTQVLEIQTQVMVLVVLTVH